MCIRDSYFAVVAGYFIAGVIGLINAGNGQWFYPLLSACYGFSTFAMASLALRLTDRTTSEKVAKKKRRVELRLPIVGALLFYVLAQKELLLIQGLIFVMLNMLPPMAIYWDRRKVSITGREK